MVRVTADSNIYISALSHGEGNPAKLLALARTGKIRLAVSDAILNEVSDVLGRKFGWPPDEIAEALALISEIAQKATPSVKLDIVKEDPDDNRILECATAAASDYIVTGDKHLLRLGRYDSARILNVADFLRVVMEQQERQP